MIKTLLIYDGRMSSAERIADKLCYLIGNAMVSEITEAPSDLTHYDGFCFVFNFYGAVSAGRTRAYIARHIDELGGRRIIMVGIGFSDLGYTKFVSDSELMTGVGSISGIFISSEAETLRVGYEISRILHEPVQEVEEHKLQDKIEDFIRRHRSLALATAASGYLRCTPLAYMYLDHVFYVITEGGYKFRGILENGDASAAIYDELPEDGSRIASLQIQCKAAPVPVGSDEYYTAMAAGGMTQDKLDAMPITLFLLKIVPLRYEYLDTDLAREGYDTKQILDTEFRRKTWEAGAAYASAEEAREAAMASEKLKEEASRANADGGSALRIPDVLEEETPETDAVREAAVEAANAEARQEAGIVVKEIFTEVDEEANVGEEAVDSDVYGDEEIIDSDEYGDEEIIDSDEYGDEEIIDS
ncbi:MAG: pyridoxamine 5'-phosphate oxidase family protein, partial [Lachnospiraceae bacterium]|nr:pyridoxamine 5'-phosphate oxidase family protein [Lachnospiraceae bacterium]